MRKQKSDDLQWYPEVFRANLTALQENVWHLMMSAIYGANSSECFAKLEQDGSWQKTCGDCSQVKMDGFTDEYYETWPTEGVLYGGTVFRPMLPEPRFGVSALPLWPRPLASDGDSWTRSNKNDVKVSIWKALMHGHNDRTFYHFMWHGLGPNQTAEYVEMMMGFPKGWTDLSA